MFENHRILFSDLSGTKQHQKKLVLLWFYYFIYILWMGLSEFKIHVTF